MPIGIDPKVDFAFKYVFGREQNEPLLVLLLNAILDPAPDRRLVSLTILNPLLPQDRTDDKLSILDIRARDSLGRTYNVEMQLLKHKYLKERVLYYWAKTVRPTVDRSRQVLRITADDLGVTAERSAVSRVGNLPSALSALERGAHDDVLGSHGDSRPRTSQVRKRTARIGERSGRLALLPATCESVGVGLLADRTQVRRTAPRRKGTSNARRHRSRTPTLRRPLEGSVGPQQFDI